MISVRRQRPRPSVVTALAAALAALILLVPTVTAANRTGINVQLPAGYSIAGTVKTTGGAAIVGAYVVAQGTSFGNGVQTSATGAFSITGLNPGTYKLVIYAPDDVNLLDGWYTSANTNKFTPVAASATGIVVGPSKTGIAIKVPAGFTISGKVTTTTGVAIAGAGVQVVTSSNYKFAVSDSAGNYKIQGLAAGSYAISIGGPANSNYLRGVYTTANTNHFTTVFASATKVAVGPNKTGINIKLPTGFTISGTITNGVGTPMPNVSIFASTGSYSASTSTDATGKYTLKGLAAGSYKLTIRPQDGPYVDGYYTSANANRFTTVQASATAIAVGPNKTGANIKIPFGYSMAGKITNTAGTPLPYASVYVSGPTFRSTYTDASGNYKVQGLIAGDYTIEVQPPYGQNLQEGFYTTLNANRFTTIRASASVVTVGPNKTGLNMKVPAGYSIAGKITGPGGVALADASVVAFNSNSYHYGYTEADGTYIIDGLGTGSYKIQVEPPYGDPLQTGYYTTANTPHFTINESSATALSVGP